LQVLFWVLLAPFFPVYGLAVLLLALVRLPFRARAFASGVVGRSLRCPNGHVNATSGRFVCGTCGATYLGWIGACDVCRAPAGWFPCDVCGVGIRLPWVRG